ncbi:MAG: cytochrome d ubiquinol oxidase subunit II [Vicinamibacteria bacterium]
MFEIWYGIVAAMFAAYVVLDGFDFGAGVLHLIVARTDRERREVLAAIGPFWNGSEVWILAAGGALFVAFPRVLSSGLSGFYLPIFLVLWAIIGRGIALEFRSHVPNPIWRASFDGVFSLSSALLPILLGAALGNVLRGVPLDSEGWFSIPLFTDFTAEGAVGVLDWYTVLVGVFALVTLTAHGALFLAWKTREAVQSRSMLIGGRLYILVAALWPIMGLATLRVNRDVFVRFAERPVVWALTSLAFVGLASAFWSLLRRKPLVAFMSSCLFLASLSGAIATSFFPEMLHAVNTSAGSITAFNGGGDAMGLQTAMRWFGIGLPLAILYFVIVFRTHRGSALPNPPASQPTEERA